MAKTTKKQENKVVTRAEKTDATKNLIQELLAVNPQKHNELIEETAKIYIARFGGEDTENVNDVKGRVGSVLDIMKKGDEIVYDGGRYALKPRTEEISAAENREIATENTAETAAANKPVKKTRKTKKTADAEENKTEDTEKTVKKSVKSERTEKATKTTKTTKSSKKKEDEKTSLPPAPLQPIAPVTPEIVTEPVPETEKTQEKPTKKPVSARGKKTETKSKTEDEDVSATDEKEKVGSGAVETAAMPNVKKNEVIDVSFLFGETALKKAEKASESVVKKAENNTPVKTEKTPVKTDDSVQEKSAEIKKTPTLKVVKTDEKRAKKVVQTLRKAESKPQTADERLKDAFLRRLRSLGGDYFEYYSVYLLERYSMKNGRRLESMRISGGDRDGGIDGEIELTDKLGFRETIYIQSKNWNPDKGDERLWVVGETLLQQFIGACACRQAQDKRQNCRGIFVTTSRFTPDAKRILETMSDKIVGYDGEDLYEAAKECRFGVLFENGNWKLDEKLLSGTKAFFNML